MSYTPVVIKCPEKYVITELDNQKTTIVFLYWVGNGLGGWVHILNNILNL
ncbi:unnamed protein product [Prunus brigantina]